MTVTKVSKAACILVILQNGYCGNIENTARFELLSTTSEPKYIAFMVTSDRISTRSGAKIGDTEANS